MVVVAILLYSGVRDGISLKDPVLKGWDVYILET